MPELGHHHRRIVRPPRRLCPRRRGRGLHLQAALQAGEHIRRRGLTAPGPAPVITPRRVRRLQQRRQPLDERGAIFSRQGQEPVGDVAAHPPHRIVQGGDERIEGVEGLEGDAADQRGWIALEQRPPPGPHLRITGPGVAGEDPGRLQAHRPRGVGRRPPQPPAHGWICGLQPPQGPDRRGDLSGIGAGLDDIAQRRGRRGVRPPPEGLQGGPRLAGDPQGVGEGADLVRDDGGVRHSGRTVDSTAAKTNHPKRGAMLYHPGHEPPRSHP